MKVRYVENREIKTRTCDYIVMDGDKNIYLGYNDGYNFDADPLYRTIALNPGSVILEVIK